MNKAELIEGVLKNLGKETTKKAAGDALEAVIAAIASGIKKDKLVQIIGFGTFKVSQRAARKGRNPKTGETIKIKASKSVRFSPSTALKAKLYARRGRSYLYGWLRFRARFFSLEEAVFWIWLDRPLGRGQSDLDGAMWRTDD